MSYFEKKFEMLLEQPEPMVGEEPAEGPMAGDMDTPESLEATVDDVAPNPVVNYKKEQLSGMKTSLQDWITKIDGFNQFLNGLEGESMQSQLNNADCDTLFNDVSRSETKKIARIAQDLSGLVESLKGYLLSAEEE
tara:strand:+ start:272 stop:679 length:408 start_codon:yes stop_codon:yes gene_type:complete